MAQLDRSRHFAVISGGPEDGAAYVQDGIRFYADGSQVGGAVEEAVTEEPEVKAKSKTKSKAKIEADQPSADDDLDLV